MTSHFWLQLKPLLHIWWRWDLSYVSYPRGEQKHVLLRPRTAPCTTHTRFTLLFSFLSLNESKWSALASNSSLSQTLSFWRLRSNVQTLLLILTSRLKVQRASSVQTLEFYPKASKSTTFGCYQLKLMWLASKACCLSGSFGTKPEECRSSVTSSSSAARGLKTPDWICTSSFRCT